MGRQRKRRMQNGYFQVVRTPGGYGLQIFQPKDGGEDVRLQGGNGLSGQTIHTL